MQQSELPYIDIHTHKLDWKDSNIHIYNVLSHEQKSSSQFPFIFSVGLHPWYIDAGNTDSAINNINELVENHNCQAIGECGLDKIVRKNLIDQIDLFEKQVFISEKFGKPLILHVVKSFSEIVALRKKLKPKQIWILHGYNSNLQITRELIKNDFYFSFGKTICNKLSNSCKVLNLIPDYRIFFETDNSNIPITEIYKFAGEIKKISIEKLKIIIFNNFVKNFKFKR